MLVFASESYSPTECLFKTSRFPTHIDLYMKLDKCHSSGVLQHVYCNWSLLYLAYDTKIVIFYIKIIYKLKEI